MPRLSSITHGKLVLRGSQPQRPDHHRRQGIGELAFEHRAFARDDAVILPHFTKQKRRINIGQMNLPRALKIPFAVCEILCHYAEIGILRSQDVPNLPQHFLHAHVTARIPRAVVSCKEQLQFLAGGPRFAETQHPSEAPHLDQRADPCDQEKVGHALARPTAALSALALAGQGLAG